MAGKPKLIAQILKLRLEETGLYGELAAICAELKVPLADLLGGTRTKTVVLARRKACWHLRSVHNFSFPEIGRTLGIDHTTAIAAVQAYERDREQRQP